MLSSGCSLIEYQKLECLENQNVQCSNNTVMQSFQMTASGCGGKNRQYRYKCAPVSDTASSTVRMSSCSIIKGQNLEFLDRQDVRCNDGEVISSFKMISCSGNDMRYEFTCKTFAYTTSSTKKTACTKMSGKATEYLYQHHVECQNGEALQGFKLVRDGCGDDNHRYVYTCVYIAKGKPLVLS